MPIKYLSKDFEKMELDCGNGPKKQESKDLQMEGDQPCYTQRPDTCGPRWIEGDFGKDHHGN